MIKLCVFLQIIGYILSASLDQIYVLTDIHYDILYNSASTNQQYCKNYTDFLNTKTMDYDFGRFKCNTNRNLILSTLSKIKLINNNPQLIILGGDLIAHGISDLPIEDPASIWKRTQDEVYSLIRGFFPNTTIITTEGNNDFYEHYNIPVGDSKVQQYSRMQNIFFNNSDLISKLNENYNFTLSEGFYYSFKFNDQLTFISLNSNYFNTKNLINDTSTPYKQLQFLNLTLNLLKKGTKAILFFHIGAFPQFFNNRTDYYWKSEYVSKLESILYENRDKILLMLNFHIHFTSLGVRKHEIQLNEFYMPTIMFPALSPVYRNNPGFAMISLNNSIQITDINYYFFSLNYTLDTSQSFSIPLDIIIDKLWNISYSYKNDFLFTSFDSFDFYDFVSRRFSNDINVNHLFVSLLGGFPRESYDANLAWLTSNGYVDPINNFKFFLCAKTMLYENEMISCINSLKCKNTKNYLK